MSKAKEQLEKIQKNVKRYFNVREWMGTEQLSNPLSFLKAILRRAFVPPPESEKENFTEAVNSMGLTEKDLRKKQKSFFILCLISLLLGILVLGYAVFHLIEGHYRVFMPSLILFFVCLSFAFRYHFWYFQTKVRRLGCTFHEWCDYIFPGKK